MRNLQKQVKKAFCYQKLFWPFTVWINCSSDLKNFANSPPSASNFKNFIQSFEQFFLTVGRNNFGNKIPYLYRYDNLKFLCELLNSYMRYKFPYFQNLPYEIWIPFLLAFCFWYGNIPSLHMEWHVHMTFFTSKAKLF